MLSTPSRLETAGQPSSLTLSASSTEYISPLPKHRNKLAGKGLYFSHSMYLERLHPFPDLVNISSRCRYKPKGRSLQSRKRLALLLWQPQWLSSTRHLTHGSSKDLYGLFGDVSGTLSVSGGSCVRARGKTPAGGRLPRLPLPPAESIDCQRARAVRRVNGPLGGLDAGKRGGVLALGTSPSVPDAPSGTGGRCWTTRYDVHRMKTIGSPVKRLPRIPSKGLGGAGAARQVGRGACGEFFLLMSGAFPGDPAAWSAGNGAFPGGCSRFPLGNA